MRRHHDLWRALAGEPGLRTPRRRQPREETARDARARRPREMSALGTAGDGRGD